MTEQEWLMSGEPEKLAEFVESHHKAARTKQGRRKLRLFGSACFRIFVERQCLRNKTEFERFREIIEVAEAFADGLADKDDLRRTRAKTHDQLARWLLSERPQEARLTLRWAVLGGDPAWSLGALDRRRAALVREIFGNPFRPVPFSAAWRTDTAMSLARQMYETRDFSAMPILADALQDAGCDNAEILDHCRQGGEHVRGCWVVDSLLFEE